MLTTLRSRFIFLGFLAAAATTTAAIENHFTDAKTEHYGNMQKMATEVIQRHMEADMLHDGIRGNIYSALYAARIGDEKLLKESQAEIDEMVTTFTKDVQENLNSGAPENIKEQLKKVFAGVENYGKAAKRILAASRDFDPTNALLPKFNDAFSMLEEQQGKANTMILDWSRLINEEGAVATRQASIIMLVLGIISTLIAIFVPIFAIRSIFAPQGKMIDAMKAIAGGDTSINIPYTEHKDEIGAMAKTVQIFKDNAQRIVALAKAQEEQKLQAEQERKKSLEDMANTFEINVKGVVDMVASAATEMEATSRSVGEIVETSKNKLSSLTDQIEGTSRSVQSVASATSQLSSAVNEINQQITRATAVTNTAVDEAQKADITVQSLTQAAGKIGEVVEMINAIAAQINLLALNATIEAARAGDAGKGFAVVASEVKNLATQTTKATEQIGQLIGAIQGATGQTVTAINSIGGKIREINEISTTIAAAVEEQSVATQQIASNVQQASDSTGQVLSHAAEVSRSSSETGDSANQMIAATSELSRQSELLRSEVDKFLSGVRA